MIHHVKTFFTSTVVLRVATVFILLAGVITALWFWVMPVGAAGATAISKGVYIGSVAVGGLSREEATKLLDERVKNLRLTYSLKQAHASIDPSDAMDHAAIAEYD